MSDKPKDCEHCANVYGTLGCCDTISNHWVYDCENGMEQYRLQHQRNKGMSDYIKREDAIQTMAVAFNNRLKDYACNAIASIPAADVEPIRHGEWVPCTKQGLVLTELMRKESERWYGFKCNKCGYIYKGNALTESQYCQNCGAKMDGGK